jgi:NADH dehydrogenase
MSFPRQIAIFGGSGFIGRHTVRHLAPKGAIIRVPTRNPEKALNLKPAGNVAQIVPISCSLRSDASVAQAIGNSDAVINLTGILFERGRNTFQAVHVEAAARIARLAREQGAKHFVHMSALGANAQSTSSYARSKAAGEDAVRTFFPDAVILRPSIVFGPEDNFFNMFAALARFLPVLPLIGGGSTKFQPVYVGDIAVAIRRILSHTETHGHVFELGGPQIYNFRQLMELMLKVTGRKRRLVDLSWSLAKTHAALHEALPLPRPLITRDQVELLKSDNVITDRRAKTLRDLGITPTALEIILPTYMDRFRPGGKLRRAA